jgi:hypothetical protein
MFHKLSENGLANVHASLSRASRSAAKTRQKRSACQKNFQIEKSWFPPKLLIQSDLSACKKV